MSVAGINFETLAGGVFSGLDSQQTALAVQALLESQSIGDASAPDDDEDLFQCGKCKKQFTSFTAFVTHKQSPCLSSAHQSLLQASVKIEQGSSANISASKPSLPTYSASSISQSLPLGQNIVLADDLMTFTTPGESSMAPSSLQVGSNPFLSQVSPPSSRTSTSLPTFIVTTSASPGFSTSNGSAFTLSGNQLQLQGLPTVMAQHPGGVLGLHGGEAGATQVILQASGAQTILTPATAALGGTSSSIGGATTHIGGVTGALGGATQIGGTVLSSGAKTLTLPTLLRPGVIKQGERKDLVPLTVIGDGGEIPSPGSYTQNISHTTHQVPKPRRTKPLLEDPNNRKKLKCQYCDKSFAKNFDLQQHVRSHTGEKPFQCIVCGRAFAQKSNVKKHMQTHKVWPTGTGKTLPSQPPPQVITDPEPSPDKPAPTPKTQTPPVNVIEMSLEASKAGSDGKDHKVKMNVVVDSSYVCQYCPQKFKSYFQLKTHMTIHKDEQVYKCILKSCSLTFQDLDHFLEHTKAHEDNMSYRCHICNKLFPSLYELGVHQYSHSLYPNQGPKPGPRYFRCAKCNSKYSTPEALQHHLETVSHKHPCIHCGKVFTCERYLRRHLPLHGSIGDYKCDVCQKCFKTEHYLRVHQLIHTQEKPFACELCPSAFNRKDKLKRHMLVHETSRKYKCPFRSHIGCTKEFNRPDKLKAHIICHSGIKPYKCKECDKMFTRRPNLRMHERGHRKDYSFTCDKCGKGFLREKLYRMHKCRTLGAATVASMANLGSSNLDGSQSVSEETTPQTKAHATRRRMINITKGMGRFGRLVQTARRGRPKKTGRAGGRLMNKQLTEQQEPGELVPETTYSTAPGEAQDVLPVAYSQASESESISVVVGEDASQYMNTNQETALVTNADGSVVVIQPMDHYQHAQAHLSQDGSTVHVDPYSHTETHVAEDGSTVQVSGELTYSDNGNTITEVVQVMDKPEILFDTEEDKQEILYNTSMGQDISIVVSSASDGMTSYSLEYPTDRQPYHTGYPSSGFQQATLIATGPNMATLVMEGASGEVLTQEGIATIVTQAADQFSDGNDPQSYSILQYPISSHDNGPEHHIESQDITIDTISHQDLSKSTIQYPISSHDNGSEHHIETQDITIDNISHQDLSKSTIQYPISSHDNGSEHHIESQDITIDNISHQDLSKSTIQYKITGQNITESTIEQTIDNQEVAVETLDSIADGIVPAKME